MQDATGTTTYRYDGLNRPVNRERDGRKVRFELEGYEDRKAWCLPFLSPS